MTDSLGDLRVDPALVARVQDEQVRAQLPRLALHHPRYRSTWADAGIDVGDIDGVDGLSALPLTRKRDVADSPEAFRMDAQPGDLLWDVVYTTGTSGPPTPIYQTAHDYRTILHSQRRMGQIRGIGPWDRIANLFPLAGHPHGSWARVTDGALAVGAPVIAGMPGAPGGEYPATRRTAEIAELLQRTEPTVLWGIGGYVRRLLAHAADWGMVLPTVRMVIISGERLGTAAEATLLGLLAAVGAPQAVVSRGFGATELACSLIPCEPDADLHNPAPELHLLQVVDDEGRVLPDGQAGALCLTHLDRRGTALVRYLIGDRVTMTHEPCPRCGRAGGRLLAHHGRMDGMVKVRGNLIDPTRVTAAVEAVDGVLEHRLELRDVDESGNAGAAALLVALDRNADPIAVPETLAAAVRQAVNTRVEVEIRPAEELYSPEHDLKPRRIVVATGEGHTPRPERPDGEGAP